MLTMSTPFGILGVMAAGRRTIQKKRAYHHGDLERALVATAYGHFAQANPSHYHTMFGGVLTGWRRYPDLIGQAEAAFNVLLEAIRDQQRRGRIVAGDPIELAEITWALSHGVATLGMARQLQRTPKTVEELAVLGSHFLQDGLRQKQRANRARAAASPARGRA